MELQNILHGKDMESEAQIRDINNKFHQEALNVESQFNQRLQQEIQQKEQHYQQ